MTALTQARSRSVERWTYMQFTLATGNVAYKGGIACIDLSTGKVEPGHAETDLFVIGVFAETVDATSAEAQVNVNLSKEIEVEWFVNSGSNPVVTANIGSLCYVEDDQTVGNSSSGNSVAGRAWKISTTDGVAVEKLQSVPASMANLDGLELVSTSPGAFAANDLVIGASPNSGAVYEIPATAAASTVTLPATATEGTVLKFVADGTLNGHTVQYRDATGPVNLTTALTASKRHLVTAIYLNSKWRAAAYVSP